ncbi:hypothetical protein HY572_01660 [Candidatus Micrarchaeota archaeon]|nr:hypothetical protein [Candidatus Micrarchaeota archaeon]
MTNSRKAKGTLYERQLKKMLEEKGFFVTRASGSGSDGVSPDLIVLKTTKKFALECKAWKNSLHFEKPKIVLYREWEQRTGLPIYVAWKFPHTDWRFFPLALLKETGSGYSLSEKELPIGLTFENIVG